MKDGGPAFPTHPEYIKGMSIRDWFAGMSLMGRRANPHIAQSANQSDECYGDADAMLAEREKEK
jgi:hypothetical protein